MAPCASTGVRKNFFCSSARRERPQDRSGKGLSHPSSHTAAAANTFSAAPSAPAAHSPNCALLCSREEKFDEVNEDDNIKKDSMEIKNSKKCMLVWEGILKKRSFEKWKLMEVTSEIRARKILSDKGMEHYWNLLLSFNLEE